VRYSEILQDVQMVTLHCQVRRSCRWLFNSPPTTKHVMMFRAIVMTLLILEKCSMITCFTKYVDNDMKASVRGNCLSVLLNVSSLFIPLIIILLHILFLLCRWEDNIRRDLMEIEWGVMD
jgi:hypothetical protein